MTREELQRAELQLPDEQRSFLSARLKCFAAEGNRLLTAKRAADERQRHADRMLSAAEARIDVVEDQAEELLTALEELAGAAYLTGLTVWPGALRDAQVEACRLIQKYGPNNPVEGE